MIANYLTKMLDPSFVTEEELSRITKRSGLIRPYRRIIPAYAWGANINVDPTKAWMLHAAMLLGVGTADFLPELRVMSAQGEEVARWVAADVIPAGDVYRIHFGHDQQTQTIAVPAGIPTTHAAIEIPDLLIYEGYIDFLANAAGVPEASTPNLYLEYHIYNLEG